MAIFGYARVSTDRQSELGLSLATQERSIRGYADMIGADRPRMFVERGVSGSVPLMERPQGGLMMELAQAKDIIITTKLDRCFRSASDALDVLSKLKERGASLHMIDLGGDVTGNGISKLVFTILSAVAESERDRTRERIKEVKNDQRARGCYLGGAVPIGFRVGPDGLLKEVADRQALEKRIAHLRSEGRSLREISDIISLEGVRISHVAVSKILKSFRSV